MFNFPHISIFMEWKHFKIGESRFRFNNSFSKPNSLQGSGTGGVIAEKNTADQENTKNERKKPQKIAGNLITTSTAANQARDKKKNGHNRRFRFFFSHNCVKHSLAAPK